MKCSKCGCEKPFNPPNWKKLTEGHFRTYEISNAVYNPYYESEPYWALCPECYREMFQGLTKYKDRTSKETVEYKQEYFTSSTADYNNQPTITVKAKNSKDAIAYINILK